MTFSATIDDNMGVGIESGLHCILFSLPQASNHLPPFSSCITKKKRTRLLFSGLAAYVKSEPEAQTIAYRRAIFLDP